MDKDLLRWVIIATGITVIIGMLVWNFFKKRKKREPSFGSPGDPLDHIDDSLIINTEHDDFDIVPIGSALDDDVNKVDALTSKPDSSEAKLPEIIQFSLVARDEQGFNGVTLFEVFQQVGFEYGRMKIFERLDDQNRVDFAAASMVEPGTFPATELAQFYTPGIVFFIQPTELDQPLALFDEFVLVIDQLASQLNAIKWDHHRQPLTDKTIEHFRHQLSNH